MVPVVPPCQLWGAGSITVHQSCPMRPAECESAGGSSKEHPAASPGCDDARRWYIQLSDHCTSADVQVSVHVYMHPSTLVSTQCHWGRHSWLRIKATVKLLSVVTGLSRL